MMEIGKAGQTHVAACVEMIEARRRQYEAYEPRFWKKAAGSAVATAAWFEQLFDDPENICLVAIEDREVAGFLIARNFPAPPVYDPGGPTALIDDFCVVSEGRWQDVGKALVAEARSILKSKGYVQIIVVGARRDLGKTAFFEATDLSLASTWWTAAI